jgi:formylglycine-generating enzyme required for sulfatase activity
MNMTLYRTGLFYLAISFAYAGVALSQDVVSVESRAASNPIRRLPDTGQQLDYTPTFGEDSDYLVNPPSYAINGDGTVTDNVTGLMWQHVDGGEMTFDMAVIYCDSMTLGDHTDWRLPTGHELFGLVSLDRLNPALDTSSFTKTGAEYWWSGDRRVDDTTRIWVVNAGGGIGPHPMNETLSAGGSKLFHVRAVRQANAASTVQVRFQDNGDSTVTDRTTGLMWQKFQSPTMMAWEDALRYGESLSMGGYSDWRVPNIKEIQSLNDASRSNPSVDQTFFPAVVTGKYWSSTTQFNASTRAWYIDFAYGITTYELKTISLNLLCVRGGVSSEDTVSEALLPGGEFDMGDHFGFVDPSHPSDELPIHKVKVNSLYVARTETTNKQACDLLNAASATGLIDVRGDCVFLAGRSDTLLYLNGFAPYSSIGWDGTSFSVVDFRANHPVVGIMWNGAAVLCNVFSSQRGLEPCYDLTAWTCDFSKNGYRLPTEAEWEYAGRGGQYAPYLNYPWGDDQDVTKANWPGSGDPYETGSYPYTTPAGFYDGTLRLKAQFNWPGAATSYQTSNGANAFGLYDMAGNVWEFVNDWYGNNFYSVSPYDNPKGPDSGFIMPDGKPYRGMRGGNWYNGYTTTSVNDGHSRVSNRNPSYYRGPLDPNHPWYHVGFRFARTAASGPTGINDGHPDLPAKVELYQNYPNPFNASTTIALEIPIQEHVTLKVYTILGQEVVTLFDQVLTAGHHEAVLRADRIASGVYLYSIHAGNTVSTRRLVLIR